MNEVSLQTAKERIRVDLAAWPDTRDACLRLVAWLVAQPVEATKHLTFNRLRNSAEVGSPPEFGPALDYLTGARLPLLAIRYEFIDGDEIFPLDAHEIAEAEQTGTFYHPVTGDELKDFARQLFVHFEFDSKVLTEGGQ